MAMDSSYASFELFLQAKRSRMKAIARASRNEYTLQDVQNESWIIAIEMQKTKGIEIAFVDPVYQDRLIAFVYKALVDWTEKNIRLATRLDHWAYGDNPAQDSHPLLNKLASDESDDPLQQLLIKEEQKIEPTEPGPHHSRASAYIRLLRRFDNSMHELAHYLLISPSYCYRRFNEARVMAELQLVLPSTAPAVDKAFTPKPWRSFKLYRTAPFTEEGRGNQQCLWNSTPEQRQDKHDALGIVSKRTTS